MAETFYAPSAWLEQRVRILLVGAGGTGGEVLYALARMHVMLLAIGNRTGGLHVTLMDGDRVSRANIGRQRFAPCDVGHFKADVLIHRLNLFFGLDWQSIAAYWSPQNTPAPRLSQFDLLVSCVDRAQVRVKLAQAGAHHHPARLWLDFGNGAHTGQCVLGHLGSREDNVMLRLPNVYDLFPELESIDDQDTPSCSAAEALRQQDLFVNPLLAEAGVSLLWNLLRHGRTASHGAFVDAREPSVEPLPIDAKTWACYGYSPEAPARAASRRSKTRQRKTAAAGAQP